MGYTEEMAIDNILNRSKKENELMTKDLMKKEEKDISSCEDFVKKQFSIQDISENFKEVSNDILWSFVNNNLTIDPEVKQIDEKNKTIDDLSKKFINLVFTEKIGIPSDYLKAVCIDLHDRIEELQKENKELKDLLSMKDIKLKVGSWYKTRDGRGAFIFETISRVSDDGYRTFEEKVAFVEGIGTVLYRNDCSAKKASAFELRRKEYNKPTSDLSIVLEVERPSCLPSWIECKSYKLKEIALQSLSTTS